MTARLIPFLRRKVVVTDWTQAELAEFYRVEASLIAAGMRVEADRGLTDEGEPWFVFCHADGEQDVIIHFARLGGSYLVSTPSLGHDLGGSETGDDFRALVRRLLAQYDALATQRRAGGGPGNRGAGNVVLHPAAMLWVLVAIAFLKSSEARAFDHGTGAAHAAATASHISGTGDTDGAAAQAARGTAGSDPVSLLASYALQSIMIAWAATLGPLATEIHLLPSQLGALETWLSHDRLADPGNLATITVVAAAAASDDAGHAPVPTVLFAPAGAGSVVEASAAPVAPAWHAADPPASHAGADVASDIAAPLATQAAIDALVGAHAPPEPLLTPGTDSPVSPTAEAQQVMAAAGAGNMLKDASVQSALPDTLATALDHAAHLSGASADSSAQQAMLDLVSKTTGDATTPATQDSATHAATTAATTDATTATTSHATGTTATDASLTSISGPGQTGTAAGTDASSHATDGMPVALAAAATDSHPVGSSAASPALSGPTLASTAATDTAAVMPTPVSTTIQALPNPTPSAALDQQTLTLATSAVHEFLTEAPQARTIQVQNTLVVYDPAAITDVTHVQAVTFDFSDGSHISLVGLPAELAHALAGHA